MKATMAATSGGKLVGSHSLNSVTPAAVTDGGIAFASAYFETQVPEDATVTFTFTHKTHGCWTEPAYIDEVNVIGASIVGKIRAGSQRISGPISVDILCMDPDGQPVSGGGANGFAEQDELDAGQTGTFSVNAGTGSCDRYLLGASGYAF